MGEEAPASAEHFHKYPEHVRTNYYPGGGVGSGGNLALTAMYSPNQWIHLTCQGTRMGDSRSEGPTLFATYLQSADTYSGEFHAATQKAPRLYYN